MIDVSNLKDTLKTLGFIAYGDIYEKAFSEIGCSLKADKTPRRDNNKRHFLSKKP